jgi:hypothetical protein
MSRHLSRIVIGNATLTEPELELLRHVSDSPNSTIFTANAGFNSEVANWNWSRRVAVVQDYVFQSLKPQVREQLTRNHDLGQTTVIVESNYANVMPETYRIAGPQILSLLAQRRLLNGTARGRYFRLSHQYLPSTGIIALALALREKEDHREPVGLIAVGLSVTELYESRQESRDHRIFTSVVETPPSPRQHFRSDALAIATFSFHHEIVSMRPEIDALTHTWRPSTTSAIADLEGRPDSTVSALQRKLRAGEFKFLFRKILLQLAHFRIPATKR